MIIIPWPKLLKVVICSNHQIKSHVSKSNLLYSNQIITSDSIMIQIKSWFGFAHHCYQHTWQRNVYPAVGLLANSTNTQMWLWNSQYSISWTMWLSGIGLAIIMSWVRFSQWARLHAQPWTSWWQPTAGRRLKVTCWLTAYTPGSAPGPTLGNEYGRTLHFYLLHRGRRYKFIWIQTEAWIDVSYVTPISVSMFC